MKLTIIFVILYCVYEVNSFSVTCEYYVSSFPIAGKGRGKKPYICKLNSDDDSTDLSVQHQRGKTDENIKSLSGSLQLQKLSSNICERFKKLEKLTLTDLADADEDALKECKALRTLTLQVRESFRALKAFLSDLVDLESFNVNYSPLKTLNADTFENNSKLKTLYLNYNQLENLPEGIFDSLINLWRLEMTDNKFKTLNANLFRNLRKVEVLYLQNNELEELPANIFSSMESLRTVFLDENKLTTLNSNSFGSLPKFEDLRIYGNQINSIDEAIFENNDKLRGLEAYHNPCYEGVVTGQTDKTPERPKIRKALKKCFENY